MGDMNMKCKEPECNGTVPTGKGLKARACRRLQLCEYCYGMKFPERQPETGIVIEGDDADDYVENDSPYGWLDQFHGSMR